MEPVFVYGTLKQNQPNNHHLKEIKNGKAVFRSAASTVEKYPLVISTKYNIPFLLQKEGIGYEISGEIYDVDAKMMEYLDDFENHPNFYLRQKTKVKTTDNVLLECWIYFLPKFPEAFLKLEYFENYDSFGKHGLSYVTRYQRDPDDQLQLSNWNNLDHNSSL